MGFSMQDELKSQIMLVPHLEMHETKENLKMLVMFACGSLITLLFITKGSLSSCQIGHD
jgi:hypothetical protein